MYIPTYANILLLLISLSCIIVDDIPDVSLDSAWPAATIIIVTIIFIITTTIIIITSITIEPRHPLLPGLRDFLRVRSPRLGSETC